MAVKRVRRDLAFHPTWKLTAILFGCTVLFTSVATVDIGAQEGPPNQTVSDPNDAKQQRRLQRKRDAEAIKRRDPRVVVPGYDDRDIQGWPVRISDKLLSDQSEDTELAIRLLTEQLRTIVAILPRDVLDQLQDVPLWLSPTYEGVRPTAEYHPSMEWLRNAGRNTELHQCVEFTNIAIFAKEDRRMPMMVLHELAHAYHDQVLGFEFADIQSAYETAMASGSYASVRRNNGRSERAYGMSDHKEYFAESTEAFFGRNDFYPFDREQLKRHDPAMHDLVRRVWKLDKNVRPLSDLSPSKEPTAVKVAR